MAKTLIIKNLSAIKDADGDLVTEAGPLPVLYRLKRKAEKEADAKAGETVVPVRVVLEEIDDKPGSKKRLPGDAQRFVDFLRCQEKGTEGWPSCREPEVERRSDGFLVRLPDEIVFAFGPRGHFRGVFNTQQ